MNVRRSYSVWGISLTALTSFIAGVTALGVVFFLVLHFSNSLSPVALADGVSAIPRNLMQIIMIWPGICFLLALAGLLAGCSAIPESGPDDRSRACKWICRAGISLSLVAIFVDLLVISYLRILAPLLAEA